VLEYYKKHVLELLKQRNGTTTDVSRSCEMMDTMERFKEEIVDEIVDSMHKFNE
jgi:hypothetical protein